MGLFSFIAELVVDTVKEKASETLDLSLSVLKSSNVEFIKKKYLEEEPYNLQDIIDSLERHLMHKGFDDDEYTEREIQHVYAALEAANVMGFCPYSDQFFRELENLGYNIKPFK